ncbi:MAG: hypothetical protein M1818_006118 [Claussenomyces sp. TS43310]|nr:MAG: hypothetical protein M1818_006118 [Claussenomyces sp. TS43310]
MEAQGPFQPGSTTPGPSESVRRTASSLLAKFLPNSPLHHKMTTAAVHSSRTRASASYAESEGSTPPSQSPVKSTPRLIDLIDDEDEDEIQYTDRKSFAGHSLRSRKFLKKTLKPPGSADEPSSKGSILPPAKGRSVKGANQNLHGEELYSNRQVVRQEIANTTAAKRNRFLLEKKDYFLPLLPRGHNYIRKLVEKHNALSPIEQAHVISTIPYDELQSQPKGISATMKPYQISGLSFMVYLHKNGLSGILGDEMGLGKTLQTLALIQYLKEHHPSTGTQSRPFLIVCPLSVLSSWMAEARKWAPDLKVLRFHGPVKERTRLKKVAAGEIDMFGNLTSKRKTKIRPRQTATGEPIISLDSDEDSDGEHDEQFGVDMVVTTYECFQADQTWFKRAFVWRYVVLDEGHKVKNDTSLISQALQGLKAEYRLILTGTPLQNNLAELWSLLHWLYPDVFTAQSGELFRNSFDLSRGLYSNAVLDDSRHLLELIMLRRMKNSPGVELNLPSKTEVLLFVPLSPMQRFWYTRLITRADQGLLDELFLGAKDKEVATMKVEKEYEQETINENAGADDWKETRNILTRTLDREKAAAQCEDGVKHSAWRKLMNLLMQLRKVCNHPYQITNAEPEPYELGDHIIHASGKFIVLEKLITELVIQQRKKILIFSGFTRMLDLVEDFLAVRGGDGSSYRFVRLDGSTARARRNLCIRMFNDTQSDYRVMLISTRAGGLGINLATASDVVLLDQDWNPQITLQAEARAHRIGQTNPVTIYKLVSQGTVEEQMMGRIQKKLYLSAKVTESMQDIHTPAGKTKKEPGGRAAVTDEDMPQLNTGQLLALVRRGASAISRPEIDVNEMLSWRVAISIFSD